MRNARARDRRLRKVFLVSPHCAALSVSRRTPLRLRLPVAAQPQKGRAMSPDLRLRFRRASSSDAALPGAFGQRRALTMTATTTETGLERHGIVPSGRRAPEPDDVSALHGRVRRGDGRLAEGGPLVVDTGRFTGRSPKDKFVVREPGSEERIWWGEVNQPIDEASFDGLRQKVVEYLSRAEAAVRRSTSSQARTRRTGSACASSRRARTTRCSRRRCSSGRRPSELDAHEPQALVLHAPEVEADPTPTARAPAPSSCCTRRARKS